MNCIVCGKELNGNQQKYCSKSCKKLGWERRRNGLPEGVRPRRSHLEWTNQDIQNRINPKSDKIIYIGGYTNCESPIYLMCKDCGYMFKWYAGTLRNKRPIYCKQRRDILKDIQKKEEQAEREKKKFEEKQKRIQSKQKTCLHCGKEFVIDRYRKKYCSDKCRKRHLEKNREIRRRLKLISNGNFDSSISLDKLYERDNGKCWLCQRQTDWSDKWMDSQGSHITGGNYPSIDHVIPIAKGGPHTWYNVRLAHCRCNTNKGDKTMIEGKGSQMLLII